MAKQQMDDEANLKRQARRRLIGAVALVTAVVVILPMVLDSEPQLDGQNIELRIPDQNDAGEFKPKIKLPPAPPSATPESGVTAATTEKQPAEAAVPAKPPVEETKPQPTKPAEPTKSSEPVKPQSAAQPVTKPAAKPAPKPTTVPKQGYAVQIGAYSNAAAADKLKAKLLLQGLPVYTEKSGSNVRVRVGPYATRAEAEKELKKLKAQGMHPVLSTLK